MRFFPFKIIILNILSLLIVSICHELEAARVYKGKIVSINTETFMFGTDAPLSGYIQYAPRLGQIIKPSIAGSGGKTIEMGTILSIMDITPWAAAYYASESDSSIDKDLVLLAYRNQNRYKFLAQRNAVSYKALTDMDISLYNIIGQYMNNVESVMMNKEVLDSCYAVAPFEGIITKLYFAQGQATNRPPIADLIQLRENYGCKKFRKTGT